MNKPNVVVGIDPDVGKSGVATLYRDIRKVEVVDLTFPLLLTFLQTLKRKSVKEDFPFVVVVEAGWLNRSNWHINPKASRAMAAEIGNRTGQNFAVGQKIVEMCQHYNIKVIEQKPLPLHWKKGKISHEEITLFVDELPVTNPEKRDAILMAWHYAGLPMRKKS